jgi:hydroxyethylthiazole kinase-like uncharacterized protein yjeF
VILYSLGSFGLVSLGDDAPQRWALPSSPEMRQLDAETIASGVSSLELMERAGAAVTEEVMAALGDREGPVVVLCGPGNNGGDGLVVARRLHALGRRVVAVVAWAERYSVDFLEQLRKCPVARAVGPGSPALRDAAISLTEVAKGDLPGVLSEARIVVDALLGTGQRAEPQAGIGELVEKVSAVQAQRGSSLAVIAVDLPTGVDGDTGQVFEKHIKATATVALEFVKRGCLQFPARSACGDIRVRSIGISGRSAVEFSCAEGLNLPRLRRRGVDVHKGALSNVLVVGGSRAMPGAAVLACLGALHSGAGLVTRVFRAGWSDACAIPECINVILPGDSSGYERGDVEYLNEALSRSDVVVVGPGIGTSDSAADFLELFLKEVATLRKQIVIDADALTLIARRGVSLAGLEAIMTPHPGEAARLVSCQPSDVQRDRFSSARALAEKYGCVTLLKGAGTVIHDGRRGAVVARGTPYLATPGSGDVLAGVIATCIPQAASLFDAAVCGAHIHACAGESASQESGGVILASDVARAVAGVIPRYTEAVTR